MFTTFMAFVLLYLSSFHIVTAVPAPGALWVPRVVGHEARDCANEPSDSIVKRNALDAQRLNQDFKTILESDTCEEGRTACIQSQLAQCTYGRWTVESCGSGRECFALPYDSEPGTSIQCEVQSIAEAKFDAACTQGGPYGSFLAPRHEECDDEEPNDEPAECSSNDNEGPAGSSDEPANGSDDNEEPTDGPVEDGDDDCNEEPEAGDGPVDGDDDDDDDDCEEDVPPSQETPSPNDPTITTITTTRTLTSLPTESGNLGFRVDPRHFGRHDL